MEEKLDYKRGVLAIPKVHSERLFMEFTNEKYDPKKRYRVIIEPENGNISRQMQNFYFGYLIKEIINWNIDTGTFTYYNTKETIVDKDSIDDILREHFYFRRVVIGDKITKIKKPLKLNKANMKECCDYFDTIIRFFADKNCFIDTYDFH